jgi:hypothetical protein
MGFWMAHSETDFGRLIGAGDFASNSSLDHGSVKRVSYRSIEWGPPRGEIGEVCRRGGCGSAGLLANDQINK